jgi:hypothetical protein
VRGMWIFFAPARASSTSRKSSARGSIGQRFLSCSLQLPLLFPSFLARMRAETEHKAVLRIREHVHRRMTMLLLLLRLCLLSVDASR